MYQFFIDVILPELFKMEKELFEVYQSYNGG